MKQKKDSLDDRMKEFYENRTRFFLPRRTYTIIRIDGKAFHTYTKGLDRPFDWGFIDDMDETACFLCKNIQGSKFAFVQSDEISILLTDFDKINTSAWFDGNIQKICSVSSSYATSEFNRLRILRKLDSFNFENKFKWANFDSRTFTIPSKVEIENYFIWRQQDTTRNSISSVAQALYSHKELEDKDSNEMQEMIFQKGINWNDFDPKLKRGRLIIKKDYVKDGGYRTKWESIPPPVFTEEREFLTSLMPDF